MARKSRKNIDCAAPAAPIAPLAYRAAAYLRLSSDDAKKGGDSIETQRNIIESFIEDNADIRLCNTYVDTGLTGTNFDRPSFKQMLSDAEEGIINCIIVKDLSRLGRNAIDTGYYIERYFPSIKVRFIAVNDGFDSNDGDGGIIIPIKNIINEAYALDISRKCKAVQRRNIQDGKFVGRMAPYGYMKDPLDKRHLIVDPEAAVIVRQMFEWAAAGEKSTQITRKLNDMGVPPPSHYKRAKGQITNEKLIGSEYWKHRTVRAMLLDPVYVGDMAQGRTETINHKEIDVPRDKWIVVRNTHEPIINREIFESVGKIIERYLTEDREKRSPKTPYTENILRGKVFCAHCGYPMHRHKSRYTYWFNCESQQKYSKNACVQVSAKDEAIKDALAELLKKHAEVIMGGYADLCREIAPEMEIDTDKELRGIELEIKRNKRFLKSLYENLALDIISEDEYYEMRETYKAKIALLTEKSDSIRHRRRELNDRLDEYHRMTNTALSVKSKFSLTAEIVDMLVEKILVRRDKSLEIIFKYADEFQEKRGAVKCANM